LTVPVLVAPLYALLFLDANGNSEIEMGNAIKELGWRRGDMFVSPLPCLLSDRIQLLINTLLPFKEF
jgi:hypothetical protein